MFRIPVDDSLDLALLEPRHAPILFALVHDNRPHLRRYLPWVDGTRTVQDSAAFIQSALDQFARGIALHVAIYAEGQLAGLCGTHAIQWAHRRTELGYWLGEKFQGRGLMTRAVRALGTYCFRSLELHRLEIRAAVDNKRSRSVAERLGFRLEGVSRQTEWLYDRFVDHAMYGVLASEWG
jgi:ribosomal-protein-serine acetyltransferase